MEKDKITGDCYCGNIRYQFKSEPGLSVNYHCNSCRRAVGAQSVGWLLINKSSFQWTQGQPKRYKTETEAYRTFCPDCGSSLTYESPERTGEIDITTGSLDHPEGFPPTKDTYLKYRVPWVKTI